MIEIENENEIRKSQDRKSCPSSKPDLEPVDDTLLKRPHEAKLIQSELTFFK